MHAFKKYLFSLFFPALSCSQSTAPDVYVPVDTDLIVNVPWNLTDIKPMPENAPVSAMRPFSLYFNSDTILFAYNGCNHFFGPFKFDGDSLMLRGFGQTLIGCPAQDFYDTNKLLKTAKIMIHNGNLEMTRDDTTLVFTSRFYNPLPLEAVLNKTLTLVSSNDPGMAFFDSVQVFPTLYLSEDRTFSFRWVSGLGSDQRNFEAHGLFGMNKAGDWTFSFTLSSGGYGTFFHIYLQDAAHYSYKNNVLKIENREKGYYYNFKV